MASADGVLYERIGASYASTRREDPRIAAQVLDALGPGRRLVNVGAGTGNYEPADRQVVAVEPSERMIEQRQGRSPLVLRATAEALPLPSRSSDAALAVLTVHHWVDVEAGLAEMRRVARKQVVFFFEPLHTRGFWAVEYFPDFAKVASEQNAPGEERIRNSLRVIEVRTVLVPANCTDGFGAAFWARPEAYLDPKVQAGMSWLALQPAEALRHGSARLAADLSSGEWDRRYGHLRTQADFDGGYRIALAEE